MCDVFSKKPQLNINYSTESPRLNFKLNEKEDLDLINKKNLASDINVLNFINNIRDGETRNVRNYKKSKLDE